MAVLHATTIRTLVCVLLVSAVFLTTGAQATRSSARYTYEKAVFNGDPDKELNHFLISNVSGADRVWVGAMSTIIEIDTDLKHIRNASKDPANCESPCENPNKILVEAPAPLNSILYCKGVDGLCGYLDMTDLSLYSNNARGNEYEVTEMGSARRFVGQVATVSNGNMYFCVGASVTAYSFGLYPISMRIASPDDHFTFLTDETTSYASQPVNFLQILPWQDYLFFVVHDSLYSTPRSKLGRLCLSSDFGRGRPLNQYMEIILLCQFGLLQSAHIGPAGPRLAMSLGIDEMDYLLYGVFSDGTSSAMCYYTLDSIQEKFVDAVYGCSSQYADAPLAAEISYFDDADCPEYWSVTRDIAVSAQCTSTYTGATIFSYAEASVPLTGYTAVDLIEGPAASIVTITLDNEKVAFVASTDGFLHKVHIENVTSARVYEAVDLATTNVLSDIHLDEEKEELYILSTSELMKLDIINCAQFETCDSCIGPTTRDGDPFCGWCSSQTSCTRRSECGGADADPLKWLVYTDECIAIKNVYPSAQYIGSPSQDISFSVVNLPTPNGGQYMCRFDGQTVQPSMVEGNNFICRTPPVSDRPPINSGDFAIMTLEVFYSGTNKVIASQQYPFFDCGLNRGCLTCISSTWGCDWCVYGYSCTHDTNRDPCNGASEVIVSHNDAPMCPQMDPISAEILIPVGVHRSFGLTGQNLPNDYRVTYRCLLDIQGVQQVASASLDVDGTRVTCHSMYYYDSSDGSLLLNVSISVEYNPGHVIDDQNNNTVTLYDCGAIGSSCSSCIAPSVPRVLTCGWCPGDSQCKIQGIGCSDYQPHDSTCPRPVISGFNPSSGPIEGNTTLTIFGTDIGKEFDDIISITVAGLECSLNPPWLNYVPGVSVQCLTSASASTLTGVVSVTVQRLVAGEVEINTAEYTDTDFSYKDPTLTGFSPHTGIRAGGTLVTLTGTYLDTGNDRRVVIGGAECREVGGSLTATSVQCYTGESVGSDTGAVPVSIEFDAGQRQAPYSFNYAPNPAVTDFSPKEFIYSGGIEITVRGTGFLAVQSTEMIITNNGVQTFQPCNDATKSDDEIVCGTPSLDSQSRRRRQAGNQGIDRVDVTFAFDGFVDAPRRVTYCPNPVYWRLPGETYQLKEGQTLLELQGINLDCIEDEQPDSYIEVCVGMGRGTVLDQFTNASLTVVIPTEEPGGGGCDGETLTGCNADLPCIVVQHGRNLNFTLGNIRYHVARSSVPIIVGSVAGVLGVIIIIFVVFTIISYRNYRREKDQIEQQIQAVKMQDF